ncbi:site-specific integrase [Granulicella sp. L60]|uniref:site-specific integrase n=1 Tax=Granulicella sp. L60 TaxID=1641866 RepID=UPI00131DF7EC|nr:site-specific integrase [Granulicella sp. L60]
MATIVKTTSGTWKAVIRKTGWPTAAKTFRTKRDAEDWSRRTEDEMVRGAYIQRAAADRMTLADALKRYLKEVTPTKRPSSQDPEHRRAAILIKHLGKYSLAALTPEIIAQFRDVRLAGNDRKDENGRPIPRANNTVRLELALLGHLFTVAIKEWSIGLPFSPVTNIRRPAPGAGRNRRLSSDEERRLLNAVDQHSNPILRWIVRIALETGMRSSEILTLRRIQVDIKRRIVRLLETKNTSPRTVPLTTTATELFREALNHPVRPIDTDLIFFGEPGRDGKRRPYQFNPIWRNIKHSLGLADVRFHDLRHEAVSRFVEAGFSDQEVSAISGHKSMQMLKRYTHLRAEDLVSRIDEVSRRRAFKA